MFQRTTQMHNMTTKAGPNLRLSRTAGWNISVSQLDTVYLMCNRNISTSCMLSSGLFPSIQILCADISEHSVPSSWAGGCVKNELDLGMLGYYMRKGLARN